MTRMAQHLNDHLATRRSPGYVLSTAEFFLRKFVEYAGSVGSHRNSSWRGGTTTATPATPPGAPAWAY